MEGNAIAGLIFFGIWLGIIGLAIASFVFWIMMIVDAAKRKFPKSEEQIVWIVVLVVSGIVGAIVYYFLVKKKQQ